MSASERLKRIQGQLTDGQSTGNINLVYASISNLIREVARLHMVTQALAGEGQVSHETWGRVLGGDWSEWNL